MTSDEDGLSNMFSVLGDENQPSLITNDFDDDSHFAINEDAGIVVEPNENVDGDEEEEDEFCQAIASQIRTTTKDGCSFICVQPSSLTAAIIGENRTFVWSINNGDRYNSATDFFKFVNNSYSKERNFMVRKTSTCTKGPKGIPEGFHPPDGIYSQLVVCTLAGAPGPKKEGIPEEKRRARKSMKCGCMWGGGG